MNTRSSIVRRLHEIAGIVSTTHLVDLAVDERALPEHLRHQLEAHILAKEIELADLQGYAAEIGDIEAVMASFAGGPHGSDGDINDSEHGDQQ